MHWCFIHEAIGTSFQYIEIQDFNYLNTHNYNFAYLLLPISFVIRTVCVILFTGNYQPAYFVRQQVSVFFIYNKRFEKEQTEKDSWWARLDSNQRRDTRRVYSPLLLPLSDCPKYKSVRWKQPKTPLLLVFMV